MQFKLDRIRFVVFFLTAGCLEASSIFVTLQKCSCDRSNFQDSESEVCSRWGGSRLAVLHGAARTSAVAPAHAWPPAGPAARGLTWSSCIRTAASGARADELLKPWRRRIITSADWDVLIRVSGRFNPRFVLGRFVLGRLLALQSETKRAVIQCLPRFVPFCSCIDLGQKGPVRPVAVSR